jgi:hypothetical protein
MSQYALSEAYSEIYDHRKIEESFDNFRFVDYMLPEHIEEVIEELVWEFRDYGNTLQESFEMIDHALEDQVICESYDQLIADVLYEATVTKGKDRSKFAGSAQGRVTTGKTYRFDPQEVERRAKRLGQVKTASRSVKSRMSKLSGPISSVKQGIAGSAGGMGKSVKALGGAVVDRGKALLKGLLRRGGKALSKTGKKMMASGTSAAKSGLASRQAGKATSSGQMALDFEPSTKEKAGGAATSVGRAIRKVGAALQRKAGKEPSKMTRGDYEQRKAARSAAAKKEVGDAFAKPKALPPSRPETATRRAAVQRKLDVAAKGTTSTGVKTSAPRKALPASTSGQPAVQRKQISTRKAEAAKKLEKAASGSKARGVRFAAPGARLSSQRASTGVRERAAKFASQLKESDYYDLIDFILEDIMSIGYAQSESEALDILESLTEDSVVDIALEYFND